MAVGRGGPSVHHWDLIAAAPELPCGSITDYIILNGYLGIKRFFDGSLDILHLTVMVEGVIWPPVIRKYRESGNHVDTFDHTWGFNIIKYCEYSHSVLSHCFYGGKLEPCHVWLFRNDIILAGSIVTGMRMSLVEMSSSTTSNRSRFDILMKTYKLNTHLCPIARPRLSVMWVLQLSWWHQKSRREEAHETGNKHIKGFCKQITEFVRSVFKLSHNLCA